MRPSENTQSNKRKKEVFELGGLKKGFTVEPSGNASGATFRQNDSDLGPKVRVTDQKVGATDQKPEFQKGRPRNPNRIAQKRHPNGI